MLGFIVVGFTFVFLAVMGLICAIVGGDGDDD